MSARIVWVLVLQTANTDALRESWGQNRDLSCVGLSSGHIFWILLLFDTH